MADANDSNSFGKPCGFDSHLRHNLKHPLTTAGGALFSPLAKRGAGHVRATCGVVPSCRILFFQAP